MEAAMNFKEQAAKFIEESQSRKRNPIMRSTAVKYQSVLTNHILPILGTVELSQIENGTLKSFVATLSAKDLSAASITEIVAVVKLVVASAVDVNGNELYPRTWNNDFIDLPVISSQNAPVATPAAIQKALGEANESDKALVALLAGTGLRINEALALTAADWDRKNAIMFITKTLTPEGVQNSTKTEAGMREIDLSPDLNAFLAQRLPSEGLLFRSATGGVVRLMTAYEHIEKLGIPGFHSFRRFRVTQLRKTGVPEGLVQFWTGHAGKSITDRYDKISLDIIARKQFAVQAGLGFQLEC
jgi:integrase